VAKKKKHLGQNISPSGTVVPGGLTTSYVQEPPTNTALLQHPLVTTTPHLGASTVDAQTRVAVDIAKQFIAFTRQTALTGAVSRFCPSTRVHFFKNFALNLAKLLIDTFWSIV